MDGKGSATDNAYIERFWRTIKRDYVYFFPPIKGWELEKGLGRFIKRYSFERSHQGINRKKPVEVYKASLQVAA
ncbi:integrase catalytic subunit [Nitritalea halalkaliphila LW7]|uniref:Integrase catalytic subunit n=2 Tax=Nitritalea TaxID=1187887 RepID=I5BV52_9BACT|nr:integrase catalytic subunit [Nitritalea halalkaliphila LW7]